MHSKPERSARRGRGWGALPDYLSQLPFDGYCVGGSLGKDRAELVGPQEVMDEALPRVVEEGVNLHNA